MHFVTARRYASAIYTLSFLCLSVTSRYCIETTGRIELVFGTKASFHLFIIVLLIRKFGYLQKLGYFRLGLCLKLRT